MVAMKGILAVVDRIAEAFDPDRVVLFGSHARGTATSDSDVDLLVILPFEGRPIVERREALRRDLWVEDFSESTLSKTARDPRDPDYPPGCP